MTTNWSKMRISPNTQPANQTIWVRQHISRAQTVPALSWQEPPNKHGAQRLSPKLDGTSYVDQDVSNSAVLMASPTPLTSKSASLQILEPTEADNQFCHTCGRIVHPYLRIALPDKVYHPDCAKCYICQISLGLSNYRDFDGKLYCSPHFAQALAEFIEGRRRSAMSTKQNPIRPIGFTALVNYADTPSPARSQTRQANSWGYQGITANGTKASHLNRASSQVSVESMTLQPIVRANTKSPSIPPRPKQYVLQESNPQDYIQPVSVVPVTAQTNYSSPPERQSTVQIGHSRDYGACAVCAKPVYPTTYLNIGGKPIHFDCLTCSTCATRLNQYDFKELDKKVYCPADYEKLVNSRLPQALQSENGRKSASTPVSPLIARRIVADKTVCFACGKKVYATEALYVMERVYHKFCFKCQTCNGTLGVENYHVLNGNPYCKPHYRQMVLNQGPETERVSVYLPVTPQPEAQPIVYSEKIQYTSESPKAEHTLCRTCQQPVHPRDGIHILQQYYHYDCFKCEHCNQKLNMGRFEMAQGKAYCPQDFLQLFGRNRGISSRQSLMHLNELVRNRSAENQRKLLLKGDQQMLFRQTA